MNERRPTYTESWNDHDNGRKIELKKTLDLWGVPIEEGEEMATHRKMWKKILKVAIMDLKGLNKSKKLLYKIVLLNRIYNSSIKYM